MKLDAARLRRDFPLLQPAPDGTRLIYLDSAATTQKPRAVLDAIQRYYETTSANVHRGAYTLAVRATEAYEQARRRVGAFVNAWGPEGVVFTRGTTEAINLVTGSWGRANVRAGDTVVVTAMDHHLNLVPWQLLCQEKGAVLRMVETTPDGRVDVEDFDRALERAVVRVPRTEALLAGGGSLAEAQATLADEIQPIDDLRSTAAYRRQVSANLLAQFWSETAVSRSPRAARPNSVWNG